MLTAVFVVFYGFTMLFVAMVAIAALCAAIALPFVAIFHLVRFIVSRCRRFEERQRKPVEAHVRTTDRARLAATSALAESYAEGRLDDAELASRTDAALLARTSSELVCLFADLPRPRFGPSRRWSVAPAAPDILVGVVLLLFAGTAGRIAGAAVVALAVVASERARQGTLVALAAAAILG